MKQVKRVLTLLAAILVLIVLLCACDGKQTDGGDNSNNSGIIAVTAVELNDAFDSDEAAASAKYVGRRLAVTGAFEKIELLSDEIRLRFDGTNPGVEGIFPRRKLKELQQLQPDQTITVTGTCTGRFSYVMLEDCELSNVGSVEPVAEDLIMYGGSKFSDGLAFVVLYEPGLDTNATWIINSEGEKLYRIPESHYPMSCFQNGLALLGTGSDDNTIIDRVIDKNGNAVISAEKQGFTGIAPLSNSKMVQFSNEPSSLEDNYVVVWQKNESYEGVSLSIGVLDTKGNWLIPLSQDNPLSKRVKDEGYFKIPYHRYLGEDCLALWTYYSSASGAAVLLNMSTKTWYDDIDISSDDVKGNG